MEATSNSMEWFIGNAVIGKNVDQYELHSYEFQKNLSL
jgi:hypothetical protein